MTSSAARDDATTSLRRIADAALARRLAREPLLALGLGRPIEGLPAVSEEAVEADAAFFLNLHSDSQAIDTCQLDSAERSFLAALCVDLQNRAQAASHRLFDFLVTPYRGGDLHAEARAALAACPSETAAGRERRRALLQDYARLVSEIVDRTNEQRDRGVLVPAPALSLARRTLDDILASADDVVKPELRRLRGVLNEDYAAKAPARVGLEQYAGGMEAYQVLIAERADSHATPETIHAWGLESIEALESAKDEMHARIGGNTTRAEFERHLMTSSQWIAAAPSEVEARYLRYVRQLEPLLPRWFGRLPGTPWAVARADPETEAGMTYGYYERATVERPIGRYRYNGSRLSERSMIGAAHLIYHELLPGHHLQISMQSEQSRVHPLDSHLQSMAALEGWAVYASSLAHEMGAYDDYALYGHYLMQSFLGARLVVDTGLNALGWPLERAREYLREHSVESESSIDSELLRYSTDIPAQALAYELGHQAIRRARGRAAQAGSRFDVRSFHDTLLEVSGYPLSVITEVLNGRTERA